MVEVDTGKRKITITDSKDRQSKKEAEELRNVQKKTTNDQQSTSNSALQMFEDNGGDADSDKIRDSARAKRTKKRVVDDIVLFFPFDTVNDCKRKLSFLLGTYMDIVIPWYSITFFWRTITGIKKNFEIYIQNIFYTSDFFQFKAHSKKILNEATLLQERDLEDTLNEINSGDIIQKKLLYDKKKNRIISLDHFITLHEILSNIIFDEAEFKKQHGNKPYMGSPETLGIIYMIHSKDVLTPALKQYCNKFKETLNVLYYQFFLKFFPQYTFEMFYNLITMSDSDFTKTYNPLLTVSKGRILKSASFFSALLKNAKEIPIQYKRINSILYNFNEVQAFQAFVKNNVLINIGTDDILSEEFSLTEQKINVKNLFTFLKLNSKPLFIKFMFLRYYNTCYKKQVNFSGTKNFATLENTTDDDANSFNKFKEFVQRYFSTFITNFDMLKTETKLTLSNDTAMTKELKLVLDHNKEFKEFTNAYTKVNEFEYLFTKRYKEYKSLEIIRRNNLVIYLLNPFNIYQPLFLKVLENASIEVEFTLNSYFTKDITFKKIIDTLDEIYIDPIIRFVNKYKELLEMKSLLPPYKRNVNVQTVRTSISSMYYLDDDMTDFDIKKFHRFLQENFGTSGSDGIFDFLTNVRFNDETSECVFNISKHLTNFNKYLYFHFSPNVLNSYGIATSFPERENFFKIYKGLEVTMIKRITNIIEITYRDINTLDISFITNLVHFLVDYYVWGKDKYEVLASKLEHSFVRERSGITTSVGTNTISTTSTSTKKSKKNKLKKLKLVDPTMYSFEKSRFSKRKYAKICQKPFHPSVYTEKELKNLSVNVKKELVKYKNITTNDFVYYHCDDKSKPYLGFITNEHPMGNYCIPCCRVKRQEQKPFHKKCLTSASYDTTDANKNQSDIVFILNNLEVNRFIRLPENLNLFFNKFLTDKFSKPDERYFIFGFSNLRLLFSVLGVSAIPFNSLKDLHTVKCNIIIFSSSTNTINLRYFFNYKRSILLYKHDSGSGSSGSNILDEIDKVPEYIQEYSQDSATSVSSIF
jgi:hypothetical protein